MELDLGQLDPPPEYTPKVDYRGRSGNRGLQRAIKWAESELPGAKRKRFSKAEKESFWYILHDLAYHDLEHLIHFLLHQVPSYPHVNAHSPWGTTPLHVASQKKTFRSYRTVETLIEFGANVNRQDFVGYTPLLLACKGEDDVDIVELLLANGAQDISVHPGVSPFHLACIEGNSRIAEFLLEHEPEYYDDRRHGVLPLQLACKSGQLEFAEKLLEMMRVMSPDLLTVPDENGCTPLHLACRKHHDYLGEYYETGNYFVADLLLKTMKQMCIDFDINAQDNSGNTPIKTALKDGLFDTLFLLLEFGATLDINIGGDAAVLKDLMHCAARRNKPEVVWHLLRQQPWLAMQNDDDDT